MSAAPLTAVAHRLNVRKLYKSILRLHRGLPTELRTLGDHYVKDEFRRNKAASTPEQIRMFMLEWTDYAVNLSRQLGNKGIVKRAVVGRELTQEQLDAFSEEQIVQLFELKTELEDPDAFSEKRIVKKDQPKNRSSQPSS